MSSPASLLLWLVACAAAIPVCAQTQWQAEYHGNFGNETLKAVVSGIVPAELLVMDSEGVNGNDLRITTLSSGGSSSWTFTHDSGDDDRARAATFLGVACSVLYEVFNGTDWDVRVTAFQQTGSIAWSHTYSSGADDIAGGLVKNFANELFVASAIHNGTDYDWLVVRYNSSGVAQSAQVLDWGADDIPTCLAADNAGNVYVAGTSDDGASGGVNVRIAKFTSTGAVAWSVPYDGGVGADTAKEIACDTSGNCYVVGSAATSQGDDVLLLRVTTAGTVDWNRRFNGGVAGVNLPGGIARDSSGGCVLNGSVYNGADYDWFTAAYDNTGTQSWRDDFATAGVDELAQDIAIDGNDDTASVGIVGSGSGTSLWTLLIDDTGARTWTDSMARPGLTGGFAAYRDNGLPRVAATFAHNGNTDCAVRAFNSGGTLSFSNKQPADDRVQIYAAACDSAGNTYVAGEQEILSSYRALLVKYDSSGQQEWVRVYGDNFGRWKGLAIGPGGNVCVTGEVFGVSNWTAVTACYTPSGALAWAATYASPSGRGVDIEVDSAGNVYSAVWGRTAAYSGSGEDLLVLTYDSGGTPGWTYLYATSREDRPVDLTRDAAGNLYIVGDVDTDLAGTGWVNFLTIKLDAAGNEQWVRNYDFGGSDDHAHSVVVDAAGNVYVAGTCWDSGVGTGVISYDSGGNLRWDETEFNTPSAAPVDMILNGNNEVCVSSTKNSTTAGTNILLLRISASGTRLGTTVHDVAGFDDKSAQIVADSQNRLYIIGSAHITGSDEEIYVARFSAGGAFEWEDIYGAGGFDDTGTAIVIDPTDDMPVAVGALEPNPGDPIVLRKFSAGQNPTDIQLSASDVDENSAASTVVGMLAASDPTIGDTHTFTLVTGAGSTHNAQFTIVGNELRVATPPDYEAGATRSIRIRATDSALLYYEKAFTIDINDLNETPTGAALSSQSVAENLAAGQVVGQFSAFDPDAGDTHSYTLVSGTGSSGNALFTISGADLLTQAVLDFESAATHSIRVRATDSGGLFTELVLVITVVDANDSPTALMLTSVSVPELHPIGTTVGTFSSTDQDAGDTHTYALVSGTGDTGNASFAVNGDELLTAAVFDFSVQSSYSIRVRTTDSLGSTFEQVFSITITLYDAPTDIQLTNAAIDENLPVGTPVGVLSAIDPTASDSHTFTLVAGLGDSGNGSFSISGNQLVSAISFNFETTSSYSVRVRATDTTALTLDKVFIITINSVTDGSGGGDDGEEEDAGCRVGSGDAAPWFALLAMLLALAWLRHTAKRGAA